jgi:anthranilate phosphoribosyltransferase
MNLKTAPAISLTHTGFAFLFAPDFHPAMARIMPVRRALGVRTLFNILGPLSNPARPSFQVIGTYALPVARKMAAALAEFQHTRRAFVVHGTNGWDEATPICPFTLLEVHDGQVQERTLGQRDHGLPACTEEDLRGGDARYNAMRLRRVLEGREFGAHRNALLLGTGLALQVTGHVDSLKEGIQKADCALEEGKGADLLERLAVPARKGVVNG